MKLNNISFKQVNLNQQLLQKTAKSNISTVTSGNKTELGNCYLGRDLVPFKGSKQNFLPVELSEKLPAGKTIFDVINNSIKDENHLGTGANSTVYNMPELDGYVVKVLNKDDPNGINMGEFPSNVNLGQPVWQNPDNQRILILKKVEGKEHSVPNWSNTIWDDKEYAPHNVTTQQAQLFNKQINSLANMPQSAFDAIAKDVKTLDDKDYKVDSINPNNLIVDEDKQQIHIIDYFKVKPHEKHIQQNCCMDLVAIMLDFTLFPEYYDKLDEQGKQQALKSVETIKEKVFKGAKNSGLSTDTERFKTFINNTSRWFTAHSVPKDDKNGMYFRYYDVRMVDFLNMLDNPQEWADAR